MRAAIGMEGGNAEMPRDFLAEAARLALQLDPLAWEFDLSETGTKEPVYPQNIPTTYQQIVPGPANHMHVNGQQAREVPNATEWSQTSYPQFADSGVSQISSLQTGFSDGFDPNYGNRSQSLSYQSLGLPSHISQGRGIAAGVINDSSWTIPSIPLAPHLNGESWVKPDTGNLGTPTHAEFLELQNENLQLRRDKEGLESHAKMLELALMKASKDSKEKPSPPDFIPSRGWMTFDPMASVILNTIFDPPKRISANDAAEIPLRDYGTLWRSYMKEVRKCMDELTQEDHSQIPSNAQDKLKALLYERHGFLSWVAANNPSICHCLLTMDMGSDPPKRISSKLSGKDQQDALKKMQLSEEQTVFLLESRNQYLKSMGYHTAALKLSQAQLAGLDPTPRHSVRNCDFLNWLSVARLLQDTVEEMHVCNMKFHFQLYKMRQGINPYQAAVLMIESYPCLPDPIGLLSELAISRKAPTAEELFKLGSDEFNSCTDHSEIKFVREPHQSTNGKIGNLTNMLLQWEALKDLQTNSQ